MTAPGLAEITRVLPAAALAGYVSGGEPDDRAPRTPHPGAQLDAFEEHDGWRYTAFATDTPPGSSLTSKPDTARTPGSRTGRTAKDTGLDHFPSRRD